MYKNCCLLLVRLKTKSIICIKVRLRIPSRYLSVLKHKKKTHIQLHNIYLEENCQLRQNSILKLRKNIKTIVMKNNKLNKTTTCYFNVSFIGPSLSFISIPKCNIYLNFTKKNKANIILHLCRFISKNLKFHLLNSKKL